MAKHITIKGVKELQRQFSLLPEAVQSRVVDRAVEVGAVVILDKVRAGVPVDTGSLKFSLDTKKLGRRKGKTNSTSIIGPRRNFVGPDGDKPGKYAHLVELGTATMPARPFMRTGLKQAIPQTVALLRRIIAKGVVKQALRLAGKR